MKFASIILSLAAAASAFSIPSLHKRTLPSSAANQTLVTLLTNAATARLRGDLVTNDDDYSYDFQNPPTQAYIASGKAGRIVVANRYTMPGLIGSGSSMAVGFLGPCGLNTPHIHPRGTEMNIVVQGNLVTNFILENGGRTIHHNASLYQLVVFPQGSIHTEYNPNCTPTVFVAAFNNEDASTTQIADAFFHLDLNIIKSSIGSQGTKVIIEGQDIEVVKPMIPANVAAGVEECLARCGLTKREYSPKMKRDIEAMHADWAKLAADASA